MSDRPHLRNRTAAGAADVAMRATLHRAIGRLEQRKPGAYAELGDAEATRAAAQRIRLETLRNLPDLLATMADRVLAAGGFVHWADTGSSAVDYVEHVANRHNAERIVKSK